MYRALSNKFIAQFPVDCCLRVKYTTFAETQMEKGYLICVINTSPRNHPELRLFPLPEPLDMGNFSCRDDVACIHILQIIQTLIQSPELDDIHKPISMLIPTYSSSSVKSDSSALTLKLFDFEFLFFLGLTAFLAFV